MRKLHSALAVLCMVLILAAPVMPAAARELPDLGRKGAMTVTFSLPEGLETYGTLTMTRVGQIQEDDGDYSFVPIEALADAGLSFEDLDSASMAEATAVAAAEKELTGTTQPINYADTHAQAVFADLELGVYLVTQVDPAEGYYAILPFLISIPTYSEEDQTYEYEIVAQSKSEPEPEPTEPTDPSDPTEPTKPSDPTEPTKPSEPTVPTKPDLPQTGQLKWPVPVLALSGVGCILLGCLIKRQREEDESRDYA